jgi:hypothetical protein
MSIKKLNAIGSNDMRHFSHRRLNTVSSTLHGYSEPGFGFAEPRRTGIATSTMKNRSMPLINQRRHSGRKAASLYHGNRLDAAASPRYGGGWGAIRLAGIE